MIAQWDSSLSIPPVSDHGKVIQGIFPGLITRAALYTEYQRVEWRPLGKKVFSLMKIIRSLQISLVYGKKYFEIIPH